MSTFLQRRTVKRRIKNTIIILLFCICIAAIVLYLALRPKSTAYFGDALVKTDISAEYTLIPMNGGVGCLDSAEDKLYYIDNKGVTRWGYKNVVPEMQIVSSENRIAVFVSGKLQMLDDDGKLLFSKVYDYPIRSLSVSDGVCAMLQMHGTQQTLQVISQTGDIIDTISDGENTNLLAYGVYGDGDDCLWLIYSDVSGITPIYHFYTYRYNEGKKITVAYTDYDQVIYRPVFFKDNLMLLGSYECIYLDYTGKVLSRVRCTGYEEKQFNYNFGSEERLFAPSKTESFNSLLCVYDRNSSFFIKEYSDITATITTETKFYVFTEYYVYTYSKSRQFRTAYPLPERITSVCACPDGIAYLKGNSVYRLTLH